MKKAAKLAWSIGAPLGLAMIFFFFMISPARAPAGGKNWTGGRTIASLQEEDFDRRLMRLQLCYGVKVVAEQCTLERRRVCKALLVHELEAALNTQGSYLSTPLEFHCEDTALSKPSVDDDGVVSLKPNKETAEIQKALSGSVKVAASTAELSDSHLKAREACEFLTDCKWATRPGTLSMRKLGSCLTTNNAMHRTILLNEVAAMLFGGKSSRRATLYPQLIGALPQ